MLHNCGERQAGRVNEASLSGQEPHQCQEKGTKPARGPRPLFCDRPCCLLSAPLLTVK